MPPFREILDPPLEGVAVVVLLLPGGGGAAAAAANAVGQESRVNQG